MPSINRIFLEMLLVEKTETPRGELMLTASWRIIAVKPHTRKGRAVPFERLFFGFDGGKIVS